MTNGTDGSDNIELSIARKIIWTDSKTLKFRLAIIDKRWCYKVCCAANAS